MPKIDLASEYTAPESERSLLGALYETPALYWELDLSADVFHAFPHAYETLAAAIEADEDELPEIGDDWTPAPDPKAAAATLKDLWQRRALAEIQEDLAARTPNQDDPAPKIASDLVELAARVESITTRDDAGRLAYPEDLVPGVLDDVREAREAYQANGDHVTGVRSGLKRLDEILGGFQPGLTILSGGPGTGKTTLALQMAADVSKAGTPALYVTFENSPEQLTVKGIAATGKLNSRDVKRGRLPISEIEDAAATWQRKAQRLAIIEGRPDLTRGQIRGRARRLMNRFGAERCLIIVDYLQLYAKAAQDLRGFASLREKVETMGNELRDVGMRLRSPVLALSSQNRSADYGKKGGGSARMDTLKESGDLEYSADAVAFLTESEERMATAPARALNLTVAKNRHGETGAVDLIFRPDWGSMRPESYHADPEPSGDGHAGGSPF
jgi:replicative DNA helicase